MIAEVATDRIVAVRSASHAGAVAGTVRVGVQRDTAHAQAYAQHFGHHVQAHCQAERRDGVVTVGGGEVVQQQGGEDQVEALNELSGTDRDHGLDDGGVEGESRMFPEKFSL